MPETQEGLAKFLFERQARTYTTDQAHIDKMWLEVRDFWLDEAVAIIEFLAPGVIEVAR